MNAALYAASARSLGRPLAFACLLAFAAGAAAMLLSFPLGATQAVLPGFATAWLFFARRTGTRKSLGRCKTEG